MQTWVTLAAKHATLASGIGFGTMPAMGWESLDGVAVGVMLAGAGFAVVSSSRQARRCPLPPAGVAGLARAQSNRPQAGTLTRIRRRVDGLLTGMLSDDADHLPAQPPLLVPVPAGADLLPADPGAARPPWHGDYVDVITGQAARGRTERPERVGSWPYLTVVRDSDEDQDMPERGAGPGRQDDDSAFWGPRPPQQSPGAGRRSKHRANDSGWPGNDGTLRDNAAAGITAGGSMAGDSSAGENAADRAAGGRTASGSSVGRGTASGGRASGRASGSTASDSSSSGSQAAGSTASDSSLSGSRASGSTASDSSSSGSRAAGSTASDSSSSGSTADGPAANGEAGHDRGPGPAANAKPRDRKRTGKHAAPSAGFGATLGRRLASPKLTSRSAAHAG